MGNRNAGARNKNDGAGPHPGLLLCMVYLVPPLPGRERVVVCVRGWVSYCVLFVLFCVVSFLVSPWFTTVYGLLSAPSPREGEGGRLCAGPHPGLLLCMVYLVPPIPGRERGVVCVRGWVSYSVWFYLFGY